MITVPVRQITRATPRTRLLNLDLRAVQFPFAAGQAVMIGLSGSPLRKPYSIASAPWEVTKSGIMQVLCQVEDSGGLDPHLELASPGTPLDLEGPFGSFGLPEQIDRPLLFIAGGTGIAPLRAMLRRALTLRGHRIGLFYSARTPDEFAYEDELRLLATTGRMEMRQTVTRPVDDAWSGSRGRFGREELRALVHVAEGTLCFICGPLPFVTEMRGHLAELGVDRSGIRVEEWGEPLRGS